jgi:hypothetical protein
MDQRSEVRGKGLGVRNCGLRNGRKRQNEFRLSGQLSAIGRQPEIEFELDGRKWARVGGW